LRECAKQDPKLDGPAHQEFAGQIAELEGAGCSTQQRDEAARQFGAPCASHVRFAPIATKLVRRSDPPLRAATDITGVRKIAQAAGGHCLCG
jgi:hypothetical protein